jgi:predicted kinase
VRTDRYPAARDGSCSWPDGPGSGKSTLAAALATELGLPFLSKDEIKEALMDGVVGRKQ